MPYLLIWDIDGTLVRTHGIGKKAMNAAFHKLFGIEGGEEGARLKLSVDDMNKYFPTGGFGGQEMER